MSDQTLAEALCSADDTQGHHEATDDYPCWQCKEKAVVAIDLLASDRMREVVAGEMDAFDQDRSRVEWIDLATAALAAIRTELEGPSDE